VRNDWFGLLVFVLFIAGTYIAEAFSKQRKRMKDIEERLVRLEDSRTKMFPPPEPLPYYNAMMRQKERTRQFLLERAQRQSPDD
jgi:cbb3-type cytochrome oxidase subunit 3